MQALESVRAVQSALVRLYDTQYLQTHPLASLLPPQVDAAARGVVLHRRLLAAIERLRPPAGTPEHALAWRPYRYLTHRYVHALVLHQVAAELGITERHCRRVHKDALVALTRVLLGTEDVTWPEDLREGSSEGQQLLESELSTIGACLESRASLRETVLGVAQTLAALARSSAVALNVALSPAFDPQTDRLLARQILLNLLAHVLHTQPGGRVDVLSRDDRPLVCLEIVVRSLAGEELSPALAATDDEHLAVARYLAHMRGIAIAAERTPREVRFAVTFPTRSQRTVLLIDDNPDYLHLFRSYLTGSGYSILEATSAEQALRLAQVDRPDVISLDVLLPRQDGWEVLQTLKNHRLTRHIPVLVCSVLNDRDLALSLGASDFIAKPVTQAALLAALDGCCAIAPGR